MEGLHSRRAAETDSRGGRPGDRSCGPSVLGAVVSAAEGEDSVEGLLLCCLKSLNLRSRSKFKMQNSSVCLFSAVHLLLFTLKYAR